MDALGVLRVLEAVRVCGLTKTCKVYQASTSELYGKVEEVPQRETTPFHPYSPYFSGELDLDIPPPLIRRKNSNRVEYNVHFSSYVGTFSIFPFIFRQKEKSHRPSDQ